MNTEPSIFTGGGRLILGGFLAFVVGAIALVVGGVAHGRDAFYAYLSAYAWLVSLLVGGLIFLMIVHAMDAKWPVALRRVIEGVTGVLPLAVIGFIPIAVGITTIYPWTSPSTIHEHEVQHLVEHKLPYLNTSSFFVRAFLYFGVWLGISYFLRRWSLRGDWAPAATDKPRFRALSALGLPPVALAFTFAGVDWLMSLTPAWYSTMFGVYWFAGGFLGALALLVLATYGLQRAGMLTRVGSSHYYALGRLLLAFTIFWAYIAYFQFFLIWITNKPHEASFYAPRMREFAPLSILVAAGRFVIPFFALLPYRVKQQPSTLAPIALWILFMHWVDMEWLVMPSVRAEGPIVHWLDVAALVCVGGAALAFGTFRLRGRPIVPKNDTSLEAAFRYGSL
ncbi:hypothetical protein [Polyangium jinanense]|uniref:Quinol:cytochrome C oxidoreductase n=1 Tax=Polyangium jinanense TaxID=2829994 RepID=A0A9X3WY84_9BACT|nr:hypothetical protein [Polyangium jinanense]MDC3953930.1 hypothetical protein [Polyangium jinanense]MDC3957857.1 hypothetical protein [Polyangium jinanense]MDC3978943.1 hypothetical protein [Polyangium jinanense]MDC3982114.1 hypothetical protein [Polyangium jinanense]